MLRSLTIEAVLALFGNIGFPEFVLILVIAVLVFGKDLPQAASKAYMHVRKLRNAVDDLRRESGIDRELRNIERTVREAEWEARRMVETPPAAVSRIERPALTPPPESAPPAAAPTPPPAAAPETALEPPASEPPAPTDGAAS